MVLPTINEVIGLQEVMPRIQKNIFHRIILLDGGSTDGTIQMAQELGIEVFVQSKSGLRNGMSELLSFVGKDCDYILTFSPDGNCDPETLVGFVEKLDGMHDLVIGSRYGVNVSSQDDDLVTGLGNWIFIKTSNFLFNCDLKDTFSIYRAFKPSMVHHLELNTDAPYSRIEKVLRTKLPWEPLMTFRAAKYGFLIGQVEVGEPARIAGERKLQVVRWGISFWIQMWREKFFTNKKYYKDTQKEFN